MCAKAIPIEYGTDCLKANETVKASRGISKEPHSQPLFLSAEMGA